MRPKPLTTTWGATDGRNAMGRPDWHRYRGSGGGRHRHPRSLRSLPGGRRTGGHGAGTQAAGGSGDGNRQREECRNRGAEGRERALVGTVTGVAFMSALQAIRDAWRWLKGDPPVD